MMLLNCDVGEDSWESLGLQEIQPVPPKGDQSWIFIGRTDVEAETPILWPPHAKSWLIWKDPDAGKDWRQEEKGMTEDEMVGWHHRPNAHEFEWAPEVGDGQGGLACCSPCGCRVRHSWATELNWTELSVLVSVLFHTWSYSRLSVQCWCFVDTLALTAHCQDWFSLSEMICLLLDFEFSIFSILWCDMLNNIINIAVRK